MSLQVLTHVNQVLIVLEAYAQVILCCDIYTIISFHYYDYNKMLTLTA